MVRITTLTLLSDHTDVMRARVKIKGRWVYVLNRSSQNMLYISCHLYVLNLTQIFLDSVGT